MKKLLIIVACFVVLGLAGAADNGNAAVGLHNHAHRCQRFRGPGDNLYHSYGFQARHINCREAKVVLLRCYPRQICNHFGSRWYYYYGHGNTIPGPETCLGGRKYGRKAHRAIWIHWID